jgi:histidinol-phosphate/aromatic aminotransferase/cobyric acid decarboxylase-like protein
MIRPRPEVLSAPLPAYAESARTHESSPVRLDFSTTLNAWGPAPVVLHALRAARPDVYPDPEALAPRQAAAARWDRPVEEITFGAGVTELIHAVCFAFLRSSDTVLVPGPTFGEYARAAALCGARVLQGTATPPAYALEIPAISAAVIQHRPRLAFLCSPNNPTGQSFGRDELRGLADACAAAGSLLVLDQSYDAFTAQPLGVPALPDHPAVLHLRSFTQDHALAGVRAAFAVGAAPVVGGLARARPPWTTSTAAQAAATAALSDAADTHILGTVTRLRFQRELLQSAFARLRIPTVATSTHFLLAAVGDAQGVSTRLLTEHGIRVRDCTAVGLREHIQVAARTPGDNDTLIHALEAVCSG